MNKLLAISIASTSIAIGAIPAVAEVDPKIHKLCIEAKDYAGCVRAMKGDTSGTDVIQRRGADLADGNQCPSGYAYIGSGQCKEVKCYYDGPSSHGHDPRVAGIPYGRVVNISFGAEVVWA